jgi:hypothetical protein
MMPFFKTCDFDYLKTSILNSSSFSSFSAVLPYSATLRLSWSALAATQSSAFPLVARPGSWRDVLSGERETKMGT